MRIAGVKDYIINLFGTGMDPELSYHDLGHTLDVAAAAGRIARREGLSPGETILVETAALLHDSGMSINYENHEEASVRLASTILPALDYSSENIDTICRLIMVTRLPQQPADLSGMILCDADLDYLGRDDYHVLAFKLRQEWKNKNISHASLREWLSFQLRFMEKHQYFTHTAKQWRDPGKQLHIRDLKELFSH